MLEVLAHLAREAPWAYVIGAVVVGVHAFFPAEPGETVLITGGVLAASGALSLAVVVGWAAELARRLRPRPVTS